MARFTREQYDNLLEHIATNTLAVSYAGKTVTFRSLHDMMVVARLMERDLGIVPNKSYRTTLISKNPRAL